jgi:hypothetical protein
VQTESEKIFERYLNERNLVWNCVPISNVPAPDYQVQYGEMTCLFEVKEFSDPATMPSGGFSPLGPIRSKIRKAGRKFNRNQHQCCAAVLWNRRNILRSLQIDSVASAALGERILRTTSAADLGADPPRYQFSGTPLLTPDRYNVLSAIVILTAYRLNNLWLDMWRVLHARRQRGDEIRVEDQFEVLKRLSLERLVADSFKDTIRTIVLENPHATVPLPAGLFAGPFDQKWRMESDWFNLAFIGSELTHLKRDGVPFIYL